MSNGQEGQMPDPEMLKQMFPDDAGGMAKLCISMLCGTAWQFLGMAIHPKKGVIIKDLPQAKLAIDCSASLLEHLKGHMSSVEEQEFNRVLSDLRMNFVSQSKGG